MTNTVKAFAPQDLTHFIREGQVTFTPAQANMVLSQCRYERQRDESRAKAHIAALAEQMRRGLWLPKTQIDFVRVDGRLVLVNGHHRMHAQITSGVDVLWNIAIHDCASKEDVAALYWKFDTTLRKRSASNVIQGIGLAETLGVSSVTARAIWGAAPIIANGMSFHRYQNSTSPMLADDLQSVAEGYAHEATLIEGILSSAPSVVRQKLRASSRMAIMLVTLRYQPEAAGEFWTGLCEDDGLAKGDPRKSLLLDMQTRSHKGLQAAQMMAVARAWSAFYRGKDMGQLKVTGHPVPIAGTPFTVTA